MNQAQKLAARRRGMLLVAGGLLAIMILVMATISMSTSSDKAGATADGTPSHPFVGRDDSAPPVLPAQISSWSDVVHIGDNPSTSWYQQCVTSRLNVSWDVIRNAATLEKQGWVTQGVLMSGTLVDAQQARNMLAKQLGVQVDPRAPVVGVSGFDNTQSLDTNRCNPFNDFRSQVRLTLLLPGLLKDQPLMDRGILFHCGNPWRKFPPGTPVTPQPSTPPSTGHGGPPPSGPTTSTTTLPKVSSKCDPPHQWISFGGRTYCGNPLQGPPQNPVQSNPPGSTPPTPGSGTGVPSAGTDSGGGGGSSQSGGTTNADGSTTPGTGAGASAPDTQNTNGNSDGSASSGDAGGPPP